MAQETYEFIYCHPKMRLRPASSHGGIANWISSPSINNVITQDKIEKATDFKQWATGRAYWGKRIALSLLQDNHLPRCKELVAPKQHNYPNEWDAAKVRVWVLICQRRSSSERVPQKNTRGIPQAATAKAKLCKTGRPPPVPSCYTVKSKKEILETK